MLKRILAVVFALFLVNSVWANASKPCIATLDWTVAETLIALGEKPCAVGDVKSYQQWVGEPALPENTLDLGIRLQPNPEQIFLLTQTVPPHFINSSFYV